MENALTHMMTKVKSLELGLLVPRLEKYVEKPAIMIAIDVEKGVNSILATLKLKLRNLTYPKNEFCKSFRS